MLIFLCVIDKFVHFVLSKKKKIIIIRVSKKICEVLILARSKNQVNVTIVAEDKTFFNKDTGKDQTYTEYGISIFGGKAKIVFKTTDKTGRDLLESLFE